jgi:hypothetical protein
MTVAGQIPGNSIQFSLMSKTCEDNGKVFRIFVVVDLTILIQSSRMNHDIIVLGWVHHVSPDADLERLTVIEWARARLQEAIQKRFDFRATFQKDTINVTWLYEVRSL